MVDADATGSLIRGAVLSHGTLESANLQASRRFYEEVLGLNVRQLTPLSIHIDLGDGYMYAVVHAPNMTKHMPDCYRNTLLFGSEAEVADARLKAQSVQTDYGIQEIGPLQRGLDLYYFRLRDLDGNVWDLAYHQSGGFSRG